MSLFVFLLIRLVPGDPVRTMLGFRATPENVAMVRADLTSTSRCRTSTSTGSAASSRGDLGQDYISHASVRGLLADRLPVTLELTFLAMLLAIVVGVPLGVLAASRGGWAGAGHRGLRDRRDQHPRLLARHAAGAAVRRHLAAGCRRRATRPFTADPVGNLRYMVLPVPTLAIGEAAYILRTTRGAMETTLGAPFVVFLRAKGIPRAARSSTATRCAAPRSRSITVIGIQFGVLLGGAIVIENVFALPGVGRLVVTAINQRNYTVVQGERAGDRGALHPGQPGHRPALRLARPAARARGGAVSAATAARPSRAAGARGGPRALLGGWRGTTGVAVLGIAGARWRCWRR